MVAFCSVFAGWSGSRPPLCFPRKFGSSRNITYSLLSSLVLGPLTHLPLLRLGILGFPSPWPNTPTRRSYPHNSPSKLQFFSLLRKMGFWFYVIEFPTFMKPPHMWTSFHLQWAHSWCFGNWVASLITSHDTLSPTFCGVMKILW